MRTFSYDDEEGECGGRDVYMTDVKKGLLAVAIGAFSGVLVVGSIVLIGLMLQI